jgi:hypothetical protein
VVPIKLHRVSSMQYTCFDDPAAIAYFARRHIVLTASALESAIYVTRHFPGARRRLPAFIWRINRPRRPILVWTHEPRFCRIATREVPASLWHPSLHVHSIYTRDVYLNNYTIYGGSIDRQLEDVRPMELGGWARGTRVVALATYRRWRQRRPVMIDGRNVDLFARRQALIARGHALGLVDVFGRGWPPGMAQGESRGGNWSDTKHEILGRYRFNICLESAAFDYYCTEKIWHAIRARCLPIYSGSHNRIYEDFPRQSFVDYDDFPDADALFRYIDAMSREEYCERLNACIRVFNAIHARGDFQRWRWRSIERTADRIEEIAHHA